MTSYPITLDLTEDEIQALLNAIPYCYLAWRDGRCPYLADLVRAQEKLELAQEGTTLQ